MSYVQRIPKNYFPFEFQLRSAPYQGKGALRSENCEIHDGRLRKIRSAEEWTEIAGVGGVLGGYNYKKNDGTDQKAVVFQDNGYYNLRFIDADLSESTPTLPEANEAAITGTMTFTNGSSAVTGSGCIFTTELTVGDLVYLDTEYASRARVLSIEGNNALTLGAVYAGAGGGGNGKRSSTHYTSAVFSFEQIGAFLFIGNDAATFPLSRWNGSELTPTANAPDEVKFLTRDKNRIVAGEPRQTGFSGDAIASSNDWTAEALQHGEGVYKTEITVPKAGVNAGTGIIIAGEIGCDAQKVVPNSASDEISEDTSIDGFTSPERGVDGPNQLCAGKKGFCYKLNPEGIHEMNSFTGDSVNLTESGEIGRKWEKFTTTNGIIVHDIKNEWIVACVQLGARNDTLIVIDISKDERPIFMVPNSYYSSLFISANELFAGSSSDGKIYKVFQDVRNTFLYSNEWDGMDDEKRQKKIKFLEIFANVHPLSSFTVNLYIDGSDTPFWSQTFTVADAARAMRDGEYEGYVFEAGGVDLSTAGVDYIKKNKPKAKFSTIRWEVVESSQYPFELLDMGITYKTKNKLIGEKSMNRL